MFAVSTVLGTVMVAEDRIDLALQLADEIGTNRVPLSGGSTVLPSDTDTEEG